MAQFEKKQTPLGNSYWQGNGAYQSEFDRLYNALVPASDMAETIHGEMIRCISRLNYDFANNGNCNVLDYTERTCDECDGSGLHYSNNEDDDDHVEDCYNCGGNGHINDELYITEYYLDMVNFIKMYLKDNQCMVELHAWLTKSYEKRYSFSDEQFNMYNRVIDSIIYQVLTEPNKPNPFYKLKEA
jgi:hypothetical protein